MSQPLPATLAEHPSENSPSSPFLPVLLILFFGSGCAALIYEVVWYQMLELAIGSTTISAVSPVATAGTYFVTVTTPTGTSSNSVVFTMS